MFDVEYELNKIIKDAIKAKASDIHIEPQKENIKVRFRIDGILQIYKTMDKSNQGSITNRVKIMSNIDIAEQRIPQDGRINWDDESQQISLRISTIPTIHGEKIVMRLLGMKLSANDLKQLGMSETLVKKIRNILSRPNGLFLITGPTGSGKSSTLYTILRELNNTNENIITLEDPVEYVMQGVNQVQINEKAGLTFAKGLRASLRQDPDIIMVGEIRDEETARLAIKSALTGHTVLSTIHTNDAVSTVERLIDMGIEPFLVKAALTGALAQRLARKPCEKCRDKRKQDNACPKCHGSGYSGRIALYELLDIPKKSANWEDLEAYVNPHLIDSANEALKQELTTQSEVARLGIGR